MKETRADAVWVGGRLAGPRLPFRPFFGPPRLIPSFYNEVSMREGLFPLFFFILQQFLLVIFTILARKFIYKRVDNLWIIQ